MQVCALFWLEIHACKILKLHDLEVLLYSKRKYYDIARHCESLQFRELRRYRFCFVRVTGRRASIRERMRDCLSLRHSQPLKQFGRRPKVWATASALAEAAPGQPPCR